MRSQAGLLISFMVEKVAVFWGQSRLHVNFHSVLNVLIIAFKFSWKDRYPVIQLAKTEQQTIPADYRITFTSLKDRSVSPSRNTDIIGSHALH